MTEDDKECSRHRGQRETDKEIKTIRELISDISGDSKVNKANLDNMAASHKELASANTATHYKLFARTEALSVSLKEAETKHAEHVKHGALNTTATHHRGIMLVSYIAIGLSVATIGVLITQAVIK